MKYLLWLYLCVAWAVPTSADTYTLERAAIGSSGGTVSGGPFTLNFTIGQVAVGEQSGGPANAVSGFWWQVAGTAVGADKSELPSAFAFNPNAPNPFWNRTVVRYAIPEGSDRSVFLGIYDLRGALVKTLVRTTQSPGFYTVEWDGSSDTGQLLRAGVYFVRFQAPGFIQHRRIVMLR